AGIGGSVSASVLYDRDAERAALGAVLVDPSLLPKLRAIVTPEDFGVPSHGTILRAFERVAASGGAIDPVTVKTDLAIAGELEEVGGLVYLSSLQDGIPKSINIE